MLISGTVNFIYINKLQKRYEQSQLDLIDSESNKKELIEISNQKEFNDKVDSIQIIVVTKEKIVYEIKESIKSIPVDIDVVRIQDSINTAFNNRFP